MLPRSNVKCSLQLWRKHPSCAQVSTAEVPPPPGHGWTGFHCPWRLKGRTFLSSDPAVWCFLAPFPFCNPAFCNLILYCKPLLFPSLSPHLYPFFHCASKIRSCIESHKLQHSLDLSPSLYQWLNLQEYGWCLHHCPFPHLRHPSATEQERYWLCISGKEDLFWDQPKKGEGQGLHGLALDCLFDRNVLLKQMLRLYFQLRSSPEQVSGFLSPVPSRLVQ